MFVDEDIKSTYFDIYKIELVIRILSDLLTSTITFWKFLPPYDTIIIKRDTGGIV